MKRKIVLRSMKLCCERQRCLSRECVCVTEYEIALRNAKMLMEYETCIMEYDMSYDCEDV